MLKQLNSLCWKSAGKDSLNTVFYPRHKNFSGHSVERLHYPHDKVEGLWVVDEQHLAVLNDDDYGFSETDGVMEQKYINVEKTKIDTNTLYIIDGLDFLVDSILLSYKKEAICLFFNHK